MKIAPSLLSADFANLEKEVREIEKSGADLLHLDMMDGHFVPNLTFGVPIINAIRKHTKLPFDIHMMVFNPEKYLSELEKVGVQMISFHQEASIHQDRIIQEIKERKIKAGIAINPATSINNIEPILPILDYVLIMSVNPGFGGQKFIYYTLEKVKKLKKIIQNNGYNTLIEVDGGIKAENIQLLKDAGADICVAGSAVFGKPDRKKAIDILKI
ncbi:ribulose-phosphate 3-epimerase [Dialister micraerophilus]|uniref:Ribulose-phosphate 3-epimerase n=1 Tax=Dialister micraerophilus DSM 19965 TaxID=888062 RepID=F2BV64_9FIRM|nr:ribulose-phosphate 3-epimerase [Dialister micraerophilus]EGF16605.1 ribulose-phosphate 3-epimerase [Dialister micraerophilus DSM 19965]